MRLILFALILFACAEKELTIQELNDYVRDEANGLSKSEEYNSYKIRVTYRPTDLLVAQELNGSFDTTKISSSRKKYSPYYYFILSLTKNDKEALHVTEEGQGQYGELVQVLSFRMREYVSLTTSDSDTIQVADFILNRTYGMGSSTDLLFAFNKDKASDKDWVQFNMNEFGMKTGNQRFRFDRTKLDNTPVVKFNMALN